MSIYHVYYYWQLYSWIITVEFRYKNTKYTLDLIVEHRRHFKGILHNTLNA